MLVDPGVGCRGDTKPHVAGRKLQKPKPFRASRTQWKNQPFFGCFILPEENMWFSFPDPVMLVYFKGYLGWLSFVVTRAILKIQLSQLPPPYKQPKWTRSAITIVLSVPKKKQQNLGDNRRILKGEVNSPFIFPQEHPLPLGTPRDP